MTPETHLVEWKESWRDDYLRWLCGFANADGGTLIIGRNDEGVAVGAPDAERLHYGSKLTGHVAVYTHRDPARVLPQWAGKKIHDAENIALTSFDPGFVDAVADAVTRRNTVTLSVTEGQLYLDVNGTSLTSTLHRHPIA